MASLNIFKRLWNTVRLRVVRVDPPRFNNGGSLFVRRNDNTLYFKDENNVVTNIMGGGNVDSVFGRTGVVIAVANDYTASQIISNDTGETVQDKIDTLDAFVDEDVTIGSSPTLNGANISGISNSATDITTDETGESVQDYIDTHNCGNILTVGVGCEHATIQDAVDVAITGDTILVSPGTYIETVTLAVSNITIIGVGKAQSVILQQVNANVFDFNTQTQIQVRNMTIRCTAATTAINTIQGSTGSCTFKYCQLRMVSSQALVQVAQPKVGYVSGTGTLNIRRGQIQYLHTGACGGAAQKGAFGLGNGGEINLQYLDNITITNSGTALVSTIGLDLATTGIFKFSDCHTTIIDPNATFVVGLAYLGGTGIDHEFYRNEIHVEISGNTGYAFYAADTAITSRFFFNHFHVYTEDTGGMCYSFYVGANSTLISHFDDIVAMDGVNNGGGTYTYVNSDIDGSLVISDTLTVNNVDILGTEKITEIIIDGNGGAIVNGYKGHVTIPYDCVITEIYLESDIATTTSLDLWRCTQAEYDGGVTHPVSSDSICDATGATPPNINASTKGSDNTLSDWLTALSRNDKLGYNVGVNNNATRINLTLFGYKT